MARLNGHSLEGRDERSPFRSPHSLLVGLLLLLAASGCARRVHPAAAPDPAVDRRILEELRGRIGAEPSLHAAQLRVDVERARVRLYGSVDGIGAWNCALRNAWLIAGVEGVTDFLVIERGPAEVPCVAARR